MYIELVYAFLSDIAIFEIEFYAMEIIGTSIITFFNVFTIIYKMRCVPTEPDKQDENDS